MQRPTLLKLAIVQSGRTARDIADTAGIHETTLSKYVNGWHGHEGTREKIARALSVPVTDLFPTDESKAAA